MSQINSYVHGGTVSSPNQTFSWASLNKQLTSKVWDWAGIELATPESAVRPASVARHVTNCAMQPEIASVLVYTLCSHLYELPNFVAFPLSECLPLPVKGFQVQQGLNVV